MSTAANSSPRLTAAWVMVVIFALFCLILVPIGLDAGNSEVLVGLGWFGLLMVALGVLLALDWLPNTQDDSCLADHDCHCEALLSGARRIKQPVNTWSDLGFVAAGLLVFFLIGADRLSGITPTNPLRESSLYSIVYGLLVIYLGPGSMFYHASIKKWGGWLDNMSMALWTGFLIVYVLARGIPMSESLAAIVFLVIAVFSGAIIWFVEGSGKFIFGGMVAVWGVLEIIILIAQATGNSVMGLHRSEWGWLVVAAAAFGLAIFIWLRSKDGQPWCFPDSWAQGHAAWHLLSAVSAFSIFLYLRSEIMV